MIESVNILVLDDVPSDRALIHKSICNSFGCKELSRNIVSDDNTFEEYYYQSDSIQLRIIEMLELNLEAVNLTVIQNIDKLSCIIFDMAWTPKQYEDNYLNGFMAYGPDEMKRIFDNAVQNGQISTLLGGMQFLYNWDSKWKSLFFIRPQLISKSVYFNDALEQVLNYLGVQWIIDSKSLSSEDQKVFEYILKHSQLSFKKDYWHFNFLKSVKSLDLVSNDENTKKTLVKIKTAAENNDSILLIGENGVGKNYYAKYIHNISNRHQKPFYILGSECIKDENIEFELFGINKKSNSNFIGNGKGIFENANGGTIYFEKIENWSSKLQYNIYGILREKKIRSVEDFSELNLDVKIVSSSTLSVQELKKLKFRDDLLHLLKVQQIVLPPLRERKGDICGFINLFSERTIEITESALKALITYNWSRNISELKEFITELLLVKSDLKRIDLLDLPNEIKDYNPNYEYNDILEDLC
jgi:transcriptional regulator with AAA-type ATPase domain